jgi:hypothetical protein
VERELETGDETAAAEGCNSVIRHYWSRDLFTDEDGTSPGAKTWEGITVRGRVRVEEKWRKKLTTMVMIKEQK